MADSISEEGGRAEMREFRKIAIEQPADVDVSELIVRPTASPF